MTANHEDRNIQQVKDYFKYCVDGKDTSRIREFFSEDVKIFRPDVPEPITDLNTFENKLKSCVTERYDSLETSFQKIIAKGDEVVVALTHEAKGSNTWNGHDVSGKDVTWTSLTYFKFDDQGFVIEEIVERNELHMAHQLGLKLVS